jgi:ubiquinone/menaquinone biosynthesis C-methylase UbiE
MPWWLNRANSTMNNATLEQLHLKPNDRFLEIGFGGGGLLKQILSLQQLQLVAGIDVSQTIAKSAKRRLQSFAIDEKLLIGCGDAEALPFGDETFTCICTVNTLYFWKNRVAAFAECHRTLETGGRLVICFNSKRDLQGWAGHVHGFRLYEVSQVEQLMTDAGFSEIESTTGYDSAQGEFFCISGKSN